MASAWLIRLFIDRQARFGFATDRESVPDRGVPFDMFGVEFSHQGDGCTFETLCALFAIDGSPFSRIAAIVHDLDLKDGKFGHPETDGIRTMIAALCASCDDDAERLRRGAMLLDDLYGLFQRQGR